MANFDARLKKAKGMWNAAKERVKESAGGFQEYEDGKYLARCTNLELGESQNGRFQAVFTWKFEEGDYEGKEKKAFQGLESEDGFTFFGRDLDRLGYEAPDDLTTAAIEAIAKDIRKTKPLARIVLKTKGDFQNLYINKLLAGRSTDEDEETEDMSGAAEEEEVEETEADTSEEVEEEAAEDEAEEEEEEEEEAEEEEEEETVDLAVGMAVVVNSKDGDVQGKVIEILAKEGKVRVKTDTGKTLKVTVDKVEVLADEPPAAPPAKAKGKAAPAPAPAKKGKK